MHLRRRDHAHQPPQLLLETAAHGLAEERPALPRRTAARATALVGLRFGGRGGGEEGREEARGGALRPHVTRDCDRTGRDCDRVGRDCNRVG